MTPWWLSHSQWCVKRNDLPKLKPVLLFLCTERRSTMKMQPAVPIPLEHLDPQTPELSQLVSQWQKLWLLAVARQKHLEQHQQALKEVIVLLKVYTHYSWSIQSFELNFTLIIMQYFAFLDRWKNLQISTSIFGESVTYSGLVIWSHGS